MSYSRSKVERLARTLRRISVLLLVAFVVAAVAALGWVDDEFQGDAPFWRYLTAIADVGSFLIAAVVAYVGSALVQAIGRARSSIIAAMFEQTGERDGHFEPPVGWMESQQLDVSQRERP